MNKIESLNLHGKDPEIEEKIERLDISRRIGNDIYEKSLNPESQMNSSSKLKKDALGNIIVPMPDNENDILLSIGSEINVPSQRIDRSLSELERQLKNCQFSKEDTDSEDTEMIRHILKGFAGSAFGHDDFKSGLKAARVSGMLKSFKDIIRSKKLLSDLTKQEKGELGFDL